MIRRSLFGGLTAMLVVAIAVLVMRGREAEKKMAATPIQAEVVRESAPSPVRVLEPADLEVVESRMALRPAAKQAATPGAPSHEAVHQLTVRNRGSVSYGSFVLRLTYLATGGTPLAHRIHRVDELVQAGQARSIGEVVVDGVSQRASSCLVEIASADLK